jgi:sigma-B regulation protein RsbU (phosphoserine phosphatase)
MPLGILSADEFDDGPLLVELNRGDHVYFYTDGVNEATNAAAEEFCLHRLEEIVRRGGDAVVEEIKVTVHECQGGNEQSDDISVLELVAGKLVHRYCDNNEIADVKDIHHSVQ